MTSTTYECSSSSSGLLPKTLRDIRHDISDWPNMAACTVPRRAAFIIHADTPPNKGVFFDCLFRLSGPYLHDLAASFGTTLGGRGQHVPKQMH
ncbi:hypothetical protein HBI56_230990 [Parastagonospora nodorum]|uniref:Uncharacterized protein n=1 Tax=Phaeosphaeria nodorum (strain SN15 / ATCC MYA-4574 / FGSC 10173) TaxID=321614 RepID=A0A7U2FFI6_PHANO|nr:hypothetical protein HBH56_223930 [Parastagonospora nodorum]QRD04328.1 hypothetical protein JI435_443340 [Parastagonospora nodorum SN15]KAH3921890.1 hypothetical protein HBH54_232080 [Parastagonospora nodorum]KAH3957179.1 hypothetical protein HBH51_228090 [Parastagonospora nodorum]KAH3959954.1 hypothetical protein HBH52_240700 [Parastagonospora nodorum]